MRAHYVKKLCPCTSLTTTREVNKWQKLRKVLLFMLLSGNHVHYQIMRSEGPIEDAYFDCVKRFHAVNDHFF